MTLNDNELDILRKFFYKNSITNRERLYKIANEQNKDITYRDVKQFLSNQKINQLYKPYSKKQNFRRAEVSKVGKMIQLDLADLSKYQSPINMNQAYICFGVDLASKRLYAEPIPNKSHSNLISAVDDIIKASETHYGYKPSIFQNDNGSEYANQYLKAHLEDKNIRQVFSHPYNPTSQGSVERNIGSFKRALYKHFKQYNTAKWIDFLPRYVKTYNDTPHRVLKGKTPNEYKEGDSKQISKKSIVRETKPKFEVGDTVRILNRRNIGGLDKTLPYWSEDTYTITKVMMPRQMLSVFKYKLNNNKIYLKEDLQKINTVQTNPYRLNQLGLKNPTIKRSASMRANTRRSGTSGNDIGVWEALKLVDSRTHRGKKQYRVRWKGYQAKDDTWEDENRILDKNLIKDFEKK
jgi:hypothetical protein